MVLILTSGTLLTLEETKMMGASYKTKKEEREKIRPRRRIKLNPNNRKSKMMIKLKRSMMKARKICRSWILMNSLTS